MLPLAFSISLLPLLTSAFSVDVAIVGGGPGGLAAALALQKTSRPGTTVAVFERDDFAPKGASIAISATGWKALTSIDAEVAHRVRKTGVPVSSVAVLPLEEPSPASARRKFSPLALGLRLVNGGFAFARRLGISARRASITKTHLWHDVRSVLADRCREVCGDGVLRANMTLCAMRDVGGAGRSAFELDFTSSATGEALVTVSAGVVIACDGVRSSVRRLAPREPDDALLDEGKSVWRGVAPSADLGGKASFFRSGDGRSALVFPAGLDAGASWTVIAPTVPGRASNSEDARRRVLAALPPSPVPSLGSPHTALYQAIHDSPVVLEHNLAVRDFDSPESASFFSSHAGLCFLGDAAHPVRPTGEGTALAWEDAWQLGAVVRDQAEGSVTADALRLYEAARLPRIRSLSRRIRKSAQDFYNQDGGVRVEPASTRRQRRVEKRAPTLKPTPL